ncbi:MAG TPA: OB-fold nucleic acid binding domain-containing protein [Mycobacteriales bacterium]|jgi:hypothetical protein|nr:OB-fold nucleic acid binding domain-containing protein [Mycobacteriales bacterium]
MVVRQGGVKALFRRFTASEEELDARDLQRASEQAGATSVCDCSRGGSVTVSGRLRSVVYTPKTNLPTLEAELFDGSGTVTLVWLGRRRIVGIEPGRCLRATGRLAVDGDRKLIYNPFYELEPTTG